MAPETSPKAQRLRREILGLKALVDLGRTLSDLGRDLEGKLQGCVETLAELVEAEQASLMLRQGQRLVVRAAINPVLKGLHCLVGPGSISGQVAASGQPAYLQDLGQSDWAQLARQGDLSRYRTPSLICLPLMAEGVVMGVLNLADKVGGGAFSQFDHDLAWEVARRAGDQILFSTLHDRLEKTHAELRKTQRAKDELVQLVFHDMKAPLTAVKEVLSLLGDPALAPKERERLLDLARDDLEHLWRRLTNLLDVDRMEAGQWPLSPADVDLAVLARDAAARMEAPARAAGVSLEVGGYDTMPLETDYDLVERILVNLLANAIRFSARGAGGAGRVWLVVGGSDAGAKVTVNDSGPGVDPRLGQAIFERYASGGPGRGSSGLGLYFCRRAAELLGGEVYYSDLPQGGARFTLSLPPRPGA